MSKLIEYSLEFPMHSSVKILYKRLSTPSGLSEWFADNVNIKGDLYTFFWEDNHQSAKLIRKKENNFIRFQWEDMEDAYFEFKIQIDEMTNDVSLIITDFSEEDEKEESILLWETQINNLKSALGS